MPKFSCGHKAPTDLDKDTIRRLKKCTGCTIEEARRKQDDEPIFQAITAGVQLENGKYDAAKAFSNMRHMIATAEELLRGPS